MSAIDLSIDIFLLIEIAGLIFGLLYVLGAIAEKWWCWPAGMAGVTFYGISMYYSQMYGESMLQSGYFLLSLYGWINWKSKKDEIMVSHTSAGEMLTVLAAGGVMFAGFYHLLVYLNGALPFWDALTNGFALSATYLTARKKIENWLLWIVIDIILCTVLFVKDFIFTVCSMVFIPLWLFWAG
jgi:nicotinamide mononucleotide transporter